MDSLTLVAAGVILSVLGSRVYEIEDSPFLGPSLQAMALVIALYGVGAGLFLLGVAAALL